MSGKFAINPMLILAKVIFDESDTLKYKMKSDEEFRASIKSFANSLSRYDQESNTGRNNTETSNMEYALQKSFSNNKELISDFLIICNEISTKYDVTAKTSQAIPIDERNIFQRYEEKQIDLQLPFSSTECWQLSATHFGAQETETSAANGQMSSIDMAPYLFQVIQNYYHLVFWCILCLKCKDGFNIKHTMYFRSGAYLLTL